MGFLNDLFGYSNNNTEPRITITKTPTQKLNEEAQFEIDRKCPLCNGLGMPRPSDYTHDNYECDDCGCEWSIKK